MSGHGFMRALGAMSGTSLDGVDAAIVETDGQTIRAFGRTGYRAYSQDERAVLRAALGTTGGPAYEAAAEVVELAHAEVLSGFPEADIVGFHGQTLAHFPERKQTVQAGNGQLLAETLERPVIWDFRSADMRLGGQGAPLAPFYHFALAKRLQMTGAMAFLNLGGVGNLTWLDTGADAPEEDGACLAFDTGPGNALIDDLCQARLGKRMDEGGALALSGTVDTAVLEGFLAHRFFLKMPPKSLDRNDFKEWGAAVEGLSDADAVATLAAGTVAAVIRGLEHCPTPPGRLLVAGGGRNNPGLMQRLAKAAPCPVEPVEAHGLDGDMLEAQAFAFLAVRVLNGLPTSAPGTTGVAAPVGGGQISRPGLGGKQSIDASAS